MRRFVMRTLISRDHFGENAPGDAPPPSETTREG
jgi:hypothetical protein